MRLKDQTEEAFAEDFGTFPDTGEAPKGKGYIELLVDNIVGLDNEYESFGEAFGKSFNEDELGTLKNMALSAYEGAKEFVTSPIETTKDVATEISDSVSRLGAESLDGRIKRMYGVGYQDATEEQVTKAREAVIGDAITASSLVPAAKGATAVAKAAIPGKVQADVVGQMRSLIDGDKEFRTESKNPPIGLSADVTGSPYKPKMFSSGEVAVRPGTYSVAEFYSPTVETLRNTEFPSKGYKGSELLKLLRDKTPGVRKAELDSINLGINDMKRYTKEEILKLAEKNSYKVTAEVVDNDTNNLIQRQVLDNPSLEDTTIKINAIPNSSENPSFLPSHGFTHYDPETIAHTRMSLRQDKDGNEYMLIEELQSDLLQKKAVNPRGEITLDEAYKELTDIRSKEILENEVVGPVYQEYKGYFDGLFKVSAEQSRIQKIKESGLDVPKEDLEKLDTLIEEVKALGDEVYKGGAKKGVSELSAMMQQDGYDAGFLIERRKKPVGKAPVDDDADTVRIALQAAMAKAQDSYATSLVIPNLERIVTSGRARPGTLSYDRFMKPGSGFQKTYVSGVNKFVKQLVAEYGDRVRVESIELPYSLKKVGGKEVPNTAIKIDFSGIKDVDFRVGRFAEGGMVEDDQMNRLMQEGGMADDGMSREPVTGNEIPPGSLASEVRDDIPAQLSEGEYVVPADVLRYYGVRFFEDLRAQAKQGMMEMESDGRIGGTPVDAQGVPAGEMDEELTPEEEQMLMEALGGSRTAPTGMAYGGMTEQPISTPYQDQATMYQMPTGMQEGGMAFDRTKFTLGDDTSSGIEARRYINPTTKEERTVNFLNGIPLGIIPEGFVPWTKELADQPKPGTETGTTTGTPEVKTERDDRGRDRDQTPTTGEGSMGWAKENYDAITANPFDFGMKALTGASENKLGIVGKTAIGGVFNDAGKISALADANAALSRLDPNSAEAKALAEGIETLADSLSSPAVSLAYQAGFVGSGKQRIKQLEAYTPTKTSTTSTAAPTTSTAGAGRSIPGGTNPSGGVTRSGGRDQQDTSGTSAGTSPGRSDRDQQGTSGTSAGTSPGRSDRDQQGTSGTSAGTSPGRADRDQQGISGGSNATRRAEGGLVTKPKKTTRDKKGLAS
jgi:hypothetical protein